MAIIPPVTVYNVSLTPDELMLILDALCSTAYNLKHVVRHDYGGEDIGRAKADAMLALRDQIAP